MQISDLISLAEEIVNSSLTPDEIVEKVTAYSEAFDSWQGKHPEILKGKVSPELKADLQKLASVHARVFEIADQLKGETRDSLRDVKKKGKGIMAYTDILPKRISIGRTRKG